MKAYKRQKIAMFALIATMGMTGITNISYASTLPSVAPNDIGFKQVVPKMQRDSVLELKEGIKVASTKKYSKNKKTDKNSLKTTKIETPKIIQ